MNRRAAATQLAQHEQIKRFDLFTRPRRFAQKLQAGSHAGIIGKAANIDALAETLPAVMCGQAGDDRFQLDAMQRIAGLARGQRLVCT